MLGHSRKRRSAHLACLAGMLVPFCWSPGRPAIAAEPAAAPLEIGDYTGEDVMIPMRDGVALHAQVWRPRGDDTALPILMQRSPYGFPFSKVQKSFATQFKPLADDHFIFVLQDIRGRYGSQGDFVMLRPTAAPGGGIDESTDTFDSIGWLLKTLPHNNGRVGIFGVSYLGWTTAMATIGAHPALQAISIQASPEDMYLGDDFHHNGAFRLDYGWEYAAALETDGHTFKPFSFGGRDPYEWFLHQPDLSDLDRRAAAQPLPTWRNFVAHPNYDAFWKQGVTSAQMPPPAIPDLIVAGWWDQEDFYGPLTIYQHQHAADRNADVSLVIGPWNHGGWAKDFGTSFGPVELGSDTAAYFRAQVELPWFRHWLKGTGRAEPAGALVFETGSNQWHRFATWPPETGVSHKHLYLHAHGLLSFDPPTGDEQADHFTSDPANPVPYRQRPIPAMAADNSTWPLWLADDQAPFAKRPDVLSWQSIVLDQDVAFRGNLAATLFASTTGSDADWVVKLIDVYPADDATPAALRGRHVMIADEVFRGRFRQGFGVPHPLTPGAVLDYGIDLHTASHVFKRGHRIEIQVQSTWFPLIDRNPQVFTPNIFDAKPADFTAQTHAVFHSLRYPSQLSVDVADAANGEPLHAMSR